MSQCVRALREFGGRALRAGVLLFAVAGLAAQQAAPAADDGAAPGARVGSLAITRADLQAEADRHLPMQFHSQGAPAQMTAARRAALAALIEKALVFQDATARGLTASDADIEAEFDRALQQAGPEFRDLAPERRRELLAEHRARVVRRILLDKNEARFAASLPEVGDADVRARYEARRGELTTPARAHLRHILIKVPPDAPQLEVDRLLGVARAARTDIAGGKEFAAVARELSADIYAPSGGDLGFVERGTMRYREIEAAAFALAPGQLSEVLMSMYGYHIVQCIAAEPPRPLDFEAAEPMLRDRLVAERREAARTTWLAELRQRYPVEILAADWKELMP